MTSDTNPDLGDRAGENRNEPFATTAPETAAEIPPSAVPTATPSPSSTTRWGTWWRRL